MMRVCIISAILFSIFVSACSNKQDKLDCSNIKTGKFEYHGGFSNKHFSIERNDSIQIEKDEDTGFGMKFKIEWLEACQYNLTAMAIVINGKDSAIDRSKFPRLKTEILKVTKNYYVCRSIMKGKDIVHMDTMLILK